MYQERLENHMEKLLKADSRTRRVAMEAVKVLLSPPNLWLYFAEDAYPLLMVDNLGHIDTGLFTQGKKNGGGVFESQGASSELNRRY